MADNFSLFGAHSPAVDAYLAPAIAFVMERRESVGGLKNEALPHITEVEKTVEADVALTPDEMEQVLEGLNKLREFCFNRLHLTKKPRESLKNVERQPREAGEGPRRHSGIRRPHATRSSNTRQASESHVARIGNDELASNGGGVTPILEELLRVNQSVLEEIQALNAAQKESSITLKEGQDKQEDLAEDTSKEDERNADDKQSWLSKMFGKEKVVSGEGGKKMPGLWDTIMSAIGMPVLINAFVLLGKAVLVVGAVIAAWKIAEFILKVTGLGDAIVKAWEGFKFILHEFAVKMGWIVDPTGKTKTYRQENQEVMDRSWDNTFNNPYNVTTINDHKARNSPEWQAYVARRDARQNKQRGASGSRTDSEQPVNPETGNLPANFASDQPVNPATGNIPANFGEEPVAEGSPSPTRAEMPINALEGQNTVRAELTPDRLPKDMKMSERGVQQLIQREGGLVTTAYWDVNGYAIGPGMHTFKGKPVVEGQTESAEDLLAEARKQINGKYGDVVRKNLKKPVTQNQFDAMVSVAWNSPDAGRNLAKKVSRGEAITEDYFQESAKVKDVFNAGVSARRSEEYKQFTGSNTQASLASPGPSGMRAADRAGESPSTASGGGSGAMVINHNTTVVQSGGGGGGSILPIPISPDSSIPRFVGGAGM